MKKIFLIVGILISLVANSQIIPPPGYTGINFRYDWLAGKFRAFHMPAFATTPSLQSGQFTGSGALGLDTVLHRVWFYSGGIWRRLASATEIGNNFYADSIYSRNDSLFYTKGGNEYFVSITGGSEGPGGSLQIDTTYNRLGTVIDSFNAVLKSFQLIQNGSSLVPDTTDNTISYNIGTTFDGSISSLLPAVGFNFIDNGSNNQSWDWDALAGGTGLALGSSSTAASGNTQQLLSLALGGLNSNSNQTTYALTVSNSHTGTGSVNIGGYFQARDGSKNYALIVPLGNGQIGFGTATPDATAILDVVSTTQGILPPRMTTTQKNAISSPAEGLMVYDLTLHKLYVYDGTTWQAAW